MVIEFVTYNANLHLFNKASIVFYFLTGGEIQFIPHIRPLKTNLYLTDIDIFRGWLEAVCILWFIIQLINSIADIVRLANKYNKFDYELTQALTPI